MLSSCGYLQLGCKTWRELKGDTVHGLAQVYYKLSYVDRRVDGVEQRICEDVPKLCDELGELVREWCNRRAADGPARGPCGTRNFPCARTPCR